MASASPPTQSITMAPTANCQRVNSSATSKIATMAMSKHLQNPQ